MRILSRTPLATGQADADVILDHMRLTSESVAEASRLMDAARQEIERHAGMAFLNTTIVALSLPLPGTALRLPIGPLATPPSLTVTTISETGAEAEVTPAEIITGQHPEIILASAPEHRVRVTYTAGFGTTWASVPVDLQHAVLDQALRLYDLRGDMDTPPGLAPSAARISARYTRVAFA